MGDIVDMRENEHVKKVGRNERGHKETGPQQKHPEGNANRHIQKVHEDNEIEESPIAGCVAVGFQIFSAHRLGASEIIRKEKTKELSSLWIVRIQIRVGITMVHVVIESK